MTAPPHHVALSGWKDERTLAERTRLERRFLSRRECLLCEQRLHRTECGSLYEPCSAETRAERRRKCLETYRPRKARK